MSRAKKHPGNIKQRSPGHWRVRLCIGGKYVTFSVQGTKADAQNEAQRRYDAATKDLERKAQGLPTGVTFSDLLDDYSTNKLPELSAGAQTSYKNSFKPFRVYFVEEKGNPLVADIKRAHVKLFFAWRRSHRIGDKTGKGTVSAHTVRRDGRVGHALFNHALDMDYLESNPAHRLKPRKADERDAPILDEKQLTALLEKCADNPMLSFYVTLLAETGIRAITEALPLRWKDFDLASGFLRVVSAPGRRTKSGRSRSVPISDTLKAAFTAHSARFKSAIYPGGRSPFVFHHIVHQRKAVAGARIRSIGGAFERAAKAAKMPEGFRRHDPRHRRITLWLEAGHSPVFVQQAAGHSSITTTMGYLARMRKPTHLLRLVTKPSSSQASA